MVKTNCWSDYDVTVDVMDAKEGNKLFSITVPKGQLWTRQTFDCNEGQTLMYVAQFSPIFWDKDKGKTYSAQRVWFLPETIAPGASAWNVSVCYPNDFSLVPMPPEATSNCQCDFKSIPVIPPKQLP